MRQPDPITMLMVDDNVDEIFLARRQVRNQGLINNFISERKSENLIDTLTEMVSIRELENIVVLLDISMPRQDGFETLKKIRSHSVFKNLAVIMFSVSGDESDVAKAFKLGANGYMVKPFTVDAFVNALSCVPQIQMIHHLVRKEPHSNSNYA